jgi:hypothetical protein
MPALRRLAFGLVVAAILVGCAASTSAPSPLATSSSSPAASGPAASPAATAATPKPTVAVACEDQAQGCEGPLTPGEHRTHTYDHPFSFTVPAGWTNGLDNPRAYSLRVADAPNAEFIVWSHAAPAEQTTDCSAARMPGFGTSVSEWLRYLGSREGLEVGSPDVFEVSGHPATRVEIRTTAAFTAMCPFNTDPFPVLVTDTLTPPTRHHGGAPASMTFVDFGDDSIVIWNDGGDVGLPVMMPLALPVIRSISFGS